MLFLITSLQEKWFNIYWKVVINFSDEDLGYVQFKFRLFKNIINKIVKKLLIGDLKAQPQKVNLSNRTAEDVQAPQAGHRRA